MANIQERRNKDGKLISYSIRVHRGRGSDGKQLKPWTATFEVSPTWTEKSARKKAEAFAATFEKECREGVTTDSRQKFGPYCDYVLDLKEKTGIKHSHHCEVQGAYHPDIPRSWTHETERHPPGSSEQFICSSCPTWNGSRERTRYSKDRPFRTIKRTAPYPTRVIQRDRPLLKSVYTAVKGGQVKKESAEAISTALDGNLNDFFSNDEKERTLSGKTIREYHRLIHTVLDQALKEGLVAVNVADRATPPKVSQKDVNYFQPETGNGNSGGAGAGANQMENAGSPPADNRREAWGNPGLEMGQGRL